MLTLLCIIGIVVVYINIGYHLVTKLNTMIVANWDNTHPALKCLIFPLAHLYGDSPTKSFAGDPVFAYEFLNDECSYYKTLTSFTWGLIIPWTIAINFGYWVIYRFFEYLLIRGFFSKVIINAYKIFLFSTYAKLFRMAFPRTERKEQPPVAPKPAPGPTVRELQLAIQGKEDELKALQEQLEAAITKEHAKEPNNYREPPRDQATN